MLLEAIRSCQMLLLSEAAGGCWCQAVSDAARNCQTLSEVVGSFVRSCRRLVRQKSLSRRQKLVRRLSGSYLNVSQAVSVCQAETGSCQTWFEVVRPSQRLSQTLSHCQKLSKTVRGLSSIVRCLSEAPGSCENVSEARQELSDACQELSEAVRDCRGLSEVGAVGSLPEACRKLVDACQGLCREKLSEAVRKSQKFVRRFRRLVGLC